MLRQKPNPKEDEDFSRRKKMASVGGLCERDLLPPQSEASSGLGNFWTRSTGLREASSPSSVHDRDSQGCSNPRFNDRLAITRPSTVLQNVFLLGLF